MSRTAQIIWEGVGVTIVAAILVAAVLMGYHMRPTEAVCPSLEYIIEDQNERMYLSCSELDRLLRENQIYPVGKRLDAGMLHRIEKTIRQHPMVRTAECYVTPRNKVQVCLTQRVPLLLVAVPGPEGMNYFIDTDRRVMPYRPEVKDRVLVVTGTIGPQTASTQMADFAEWVNGNTYWNDRIQRVHVHRPQMNILYCRGENQPKVVLGELKEYDRKLAKLRVFIEKSGDATQGKQYSVLDIRFRGQVVAR